MGETLIGEINGVKHYQDGHFTYDTKEYGYSRPLASWFDIISDDYNKLKAKMFNLVEATITDKTQADAVKGIIKGFCNDAFANSDRRLHDFFREMGFYDGGNNAGGAVSCLPMPVLKDEPEA